VRWHPNTITHGEYGRYDEAEKGQMAWGGMVELPDHAVEVSKSFGLRRIAAHP
jgi:hypothetical protein